MPTNARNNDLSFIISSTFLGTNVLLVIFGPCRSLFRISRVSDKSAVDFANSPVHSTSTKKHVRSGWKFELDATIKHGKRKIGVECYVIIYIYTYIYNKISKNCIKLLYIYMYMHYIYI